MRTNTKVRLITIWDILKHPKIQSNQPRRYSLITIWDILKLAQTGCQVQEEIRLITIWDILKLRPVVFTSWRVEV